MSQARERLFEKWLDAGDERTFAEWLEYRRSLRRPGAIIPVPPDFFRNMQMQQGMVSLALLQQNSIRQQLGPPFGGILGGIGGIFGGRG